MHVHFAILPFRNKQVSKEDEHKVDIELELKSDSPENHKEKIEKVTKEINRLDVIEESASPSVEYDTDSLDQSQVVIESDADTEREYITESEDIPVSGKVESEGAGSGMELFKLFLASEGETYSSHQEFLPFFALPYVVDPDEHASFTSLFQVLQCKQSYPILPS